MVYKTVYRMAYPTVRISDVTREVLREMSQAEGKSMQSLLEEAVETLRRKRFLEAVNAGYQSLRSDVKAWEMLERERREWDGTLLDGLAVHESPRRYRARPKQVRRKKT